MHYIAWHEMTKLMMYSIIAPPSTVVDACNAAIHSE